MKLIEACAIGWSCGLETVGEAIDMIESSAPNLFTLDSMEYELEELMEEAKWYEQGYYNTKIKDIFPEEVKKWDEDLKIFMEAEDIDF
jgi:hypothetical protein